MDRGLGTTLRPAQQGSAADAPADKFAYVWFLERIKSIAAASSAVDSMCAWQYALWQLDAAGLLPNEFAPKSRAYPLSSLAPLNGQQISLVDVDDSEVSAK